LFFEVPEFGMIIGTTLIFFLPFLTSIKVVSVQFGSKNLFRIETVWLDFKSFKIRFCLIFFFYIFSMVSIIAIQSGSKQFDVVQNNLIRFEMQTIRFHSFILNFANSSVWFGSFFILNQTMSILHGCMFIK